MVNKNRAIKRIIETSKDILANNYNYKVEPEPFVKKSYFTQFNIYLKQYNRLSESITQQEKMKEDKVKESVEEEEN